MSDEEQQQEATGEQPVTPSGYQPAQGEGIVHIDVTVSKSRSYQKVDLTGRWVFAQPAQYVDIVPAIAELEANLRDEAEAILETIVAEAQAGKNTAPTPAAAPAVPQAGAPAPQQAVPANAPGGGAHPNGNGWKVAQKPDNKGTIDYLSVDVVDSDTFRAQVEAQLPGLGIDPSQVSVYDNRVGNYGCETTGNTIWSLVSVKAQDGSPFKQVSGNKSLVAVDFNRDGSLWVRLTKVGEQAINAVRMAQQMQQPQQHVPQQQAPPPMQPQQQGQATDAVMQGFPGAQQMPPVPPPPSDGDVPF